MVKLRCSVAPGRCSDHCQPAVDRFAPFFPCLIIQADGQIQAPAQRNNFDVGGVIVRVVELLACVDADPPEPLAARVRRSRGSAGALGNRPLLGYVVRSAGYRPLATSGGRALALSTFFLAIFHIPSILAGVLHAGASSTTGVAGQRRVLPERVALEHMGIASAGACYLLAPATAHSRLTS